MRFASILLATFLARRDATRILECAAHLHVRSNLGTPSASFQRNPCACAAARGALRHLSIRLETPMQFAISLQAQSTKVDPRSAVTLAWMLLGALADLLRMSKQLNSHEFLPIITLDCVTMAGEIEYSPDFFTSVEGIIERVHRASALLGAAENLLMAALCDRLIRPDARLPVPVMHAPELRELLTYDQATDCIRCQIPDWGDVVADNAKMLRVLSSISASGLVPSLEADGAIVALPDVSPTLFGHGQGPGHSVTSTCRVSGLYWVANEIEVRIEGFREDRVIRAQLGEAARMAAISRHPPFTAAVQFSETAPLLPLLPLVNGKVTVEKIWDIQEQPDLDLK